MHIFEQGQTENFNGPILFVCIFFGMHTSGRCWSEKNLMVHRSVKGWCLHHACSIMIRAVSRAGGRIGSIRIRQHDPLADQIRTAPHRSKVRMFIMVSSRPVSCLILRWSNDHHLWVGIMWSGFGCTSSESRLVWYSCLLIFDYRDVLLIILHRQGYHSVYPWIPSRPPLSPMSGILPA